MATVRHISCKTSRDLLGIIKPRLVTRAFIQPLALFSSAPEEEKEDTGIDGQPQQLCKGINYFKDGQDPPLQPDSEYPNWLWTITDSKQAGDTQPSNPGYWRRSNKVNRRRENETKKQLRK